MEGLKERNELDNAVIVIYGDHEGVHKYYPDEADIKGLESQEENGKRIPFIIYNPKIKPAKFDTIGGQVDLFPTLAYLLGIDESEYYHTTMGKNLFRADKGYAILRDGQIIGEIKDRQHLIDGPRISDLIIRGNWQQ